MTVAATSEEEVHAWTSRRVGHASVVLLAIVVAVGLGLRLAWWAYADAQPVSDFEYHRRLAQVLLNRGYLGFGTPSAYRPPGYPVLLAGAMLVSRSVAWLSLINVVLAAVLPVVAYLLARRLGAPTPAPLVAAALVAVNPTFVLFSPVLASEHLYAPLVLLALAMVFGPGRAGVPWWRRSHIGAGLLFGIATLTRPDALMYVPIAAVALSRRGWRTVAAFGLALVLVVLPWYVRNRVWLGPGAGLSTASGLTFYYGHHTLPHAWHPLTGTPLEGLSEVDVSRKGFELGWAYIRETPWTRQLAGIWIGTERLFAVDNYGEAWSTQAQGPNPDAFRPTERGLRPVFSGVVRAFTLGVFGAAALSLVVVRRGARLPAGWLRAAAFVGLTWIGYAVLFVATPRYRYASDVVLAILAGWTAAGASTGAGTKVISRQ